MKATIWRTYFLRFCCNKDKKNSELRLGAIPPLREPHTQSSARRANIIFFFFFSSVFTDFFVTRATDFAEKKKLFVVYSESSIPQLFIGGNQNLRLPGPGKLQNYLSDSGHNFNEMCPVQTLKNRLVWDGNTLCALKIEILFVQYYSWNLNSTKETVEKIF